MKKWFITLLICLLPFSLFADWSADGVTDEASSDGVSRPISDDTVTCTYFDSFPSAISATYWTETDTDSALSVSSGKLNFTINQEAASYAQIKSKWYFNANADFDIVVDFDITSWAVPNSTYFNQVIIDIENSTKSIYANIGRNLLSDGSVERYRVSGSATASTTVSQSDMSGRFRAKYTSNVLVLYYWDPTEKRWEWNDNTAGITADEDFTDENIYIVLYFKKQIKTGGSAMNANMDNLRIIDGCENITLP